MQFEGDSAQFEGELAQFEGDSAQFEGDSAQFKKGGSTQFVNARQRVKFRPGLFLCPGRSLKLRVVHNIDLHSQLSSLKNPTPRMA